MATATAIAASQRVPEGWRLVRLGDVAGVNPKRPKLDVANDVLVSFGRMAAVGEDFSGITGSEIRPYREVSKGYTYFRENDLLFAKITPCLQNEKHCIAGGLLNGFGFGSTEFHVVRADGQLNPRFLFRALTRPEIIRECADSFTGTAGQQRVQPDTLRSLPILLPPPGGAAGHPRRDGQHRRRHRRRRGGHRRHRAAPGDAQASRQECRFCASRTSPLEISTCLT